MQRTMLDTDIFSEVIEGRNQAVVQKARMYQESFGSFTISAITYFESHRSLSYRPSQRRTEALTTIRESLVILPIEPEEAELAGIIHGLLKRQGTPIGEMD